MLIFVSVDQAAQDLVRNKTLGRGLLYPDTFSEERLTFLLPAASAILVILSRNHNVRVSVAIWAAKLLIDPQYIADMLLKINERGRWRDPPPADSELKAQQDEEIFQITRLVKCALSVFLPGLNTLLMIITAPVAATS